METTDSRLRVKSGGKYTLRTPNGKSLIHVDYILPHPKYTSWSDVLVVYRVWIKHKRYWKHYICSYYELAIFNDWEYK